LTFTEKSDILFEVMRDKNTKTKMVKLRGPNGTTREITLDEWNSYTPLNRHAERVTALSHTLMEWDNEKAQDYKPFVVWKLQRRA
jgi:hypothetical protein